MVRLVSEAGTVVEVSEELASRLPGFKPINSAPVKEPVKSAPKRKPRAKKQ